MSITDPNSPATPVEGKSIEYNTYGIIVSPENGLTIREEFAKAAMIGILSSDTMSSTPNIEWVAEFAVKQADALIEALNQTES